MIIFLFLFFFFGDVRNFPILSPRNWADLLQDLGRVVVFSFGKDNKMLFGRLGWCVFGKTVLYVLSTTSE